MQPNLLKKLQKPTVNSDSLALNLSCAPNPYQKAIPAVQTSEAFVKHPEQNPAVQSQAK